MDASLGLGRGWVIGVAVALALLSCGETSRRPKAGAGGRTGAGGNSGAAPSGVSGEGLGGASPVAGQPSVGGESASGAAGEPAGGAAPNEACDKELVGDWTYLEPHAPRAPLPDTDACWNLRGQFDNGIYSASSRWPSPEARLTSLTLNTDGSYTRGVAVIGPVQLSFAPECLATSQGAPLCSELQQTLLQSGQGEGSVFAVACVPRVGGGCNCRMDVVDTFEGDGGTWTNDEASGILSLTRSYPEVATLTTDYVVTRHELVAGCQPATDLALGSSINAWWPGIGAKTFTHVDCHDDVQGPTEPFGIDCGVPCEASCEEP